MKNNTKYRNAFGDKKLRWILATSLLHSRFLWYNTSMQTFIIEQTDSQCVVTWRHFSIGTIARAVLVGGVFLSPLCYWSIAEFCNRLRMDDDVSGAVALLVIFGGMWFWCFAVLLNSLYGKTRFVLDSSGLETTWTCPLMKQRKQFELDDLQGFKREDYPTNQGKGARRQALLYSRMRVQCKREYYVDYVVPLPILSAGANKGLDDLCDLLNAFLEELKPGIPVQSDDEVVD